LDLDRVLKFLSDFFSYIFGTVYFLINYLVCASLRIQYINDQIVWELKKRGDAVLLAQYHGNTFASFWIYKNRNAVIFVANSFKGKILATLAHHYGYKTLVIDENDQSLFSKKQTVKFIKYLREKNDGVITWDGPLGPHKVEKPGAKFIGEQSGAHLIRINIEYKSHFKLKGRWDQYEIPVPFSRVLVDVKKEGI
jgi:lysophospholipid acyltransferase (LPLAT)-like uncharacterized protein